MEGCDPAHGATRYQRAARAREPSLGREEDQTARPRRPVSRVHISGQITLASTPATIHLTSEVTARARESPVSGHPCAVTRQANQLISASISRRAVGEPSQFRESACELGASGNGVHRAYLNG